MTGKKPTPMPKTKSLKRIAVNSFDPDELPRTSTGSMSSQISWRRLKLSELRSTDLFAREYPLTPSEAFVAANFDSYINADLVMRARKEKIEEYGPLLIGCDPAGQGDESRRTHLLRVKLRRTQCEHMFSTLPSNSDITRCGR